MQTLYSSCCSHKCLSSKDISGIGEKQVGPATAMSTVLFVIIVVITMIQLKLEGKND